MRRRGLITLAVLGACGDIPPYTSATSVVIQKDLPQRELHKVDLLLVIDDSPLMAAYRDRVSLNLPNFADALSRISGGFPDLHLAVTTTDLHDGGAFHGIDPVDGPFLIARPRLDGTFETNAASSLPTTIAQLGDVGAAGCDCPQPLESAKRALSSHPAFVRDDAALAIAFITPHDDFSTEDVADYTQWFQASRRDVAVALIAGVVTPTAPNGPSCSFEGIPAYPAVRLKQFVDSFPNRGTFTTICQTDLSDGLSFFASLGERVYDPCLEGPLADIDPSRDGVQPSCNVSDVQRNAGRVIGEQRIPPCDEDPDAVPCWRLHDDFVNCGTGGGTITVTRRDFPPPNDHLLIECVAE